MKIIPPQKLWQWDINKKVYISGITDADEWQVHFATDDDCTALVLPIKHDDSGYWAYIPNQLVSEGRLLLCYLYNQVEDWAHTETMIKIPVQRRPKPAGYTLVLTDIETRGSLREDIGSLSSLTTQTQDNLVDAINEVNMKKHNDLDGRDAADVHPMSSITGLEQKLQSIDSSGESYAEKIAQLKQDIATNEATDKSQSQAISSMRQSISSIKSASESNAAAISDMQVSISSINDVDYTQSQAIADVQSNIMSLIDKDTVLSQAINSLSSSVDSSFAKVEAALDKKQPVGDYVTSVNGNAPDKGGNVSIDVQTYTAGEGIDISDSGEIAVTNPMDDKQVSDGTTWSSLNVIKQLTQPISESGSIITCYPVEGSPLHVVSDITAVQEGKGDPSPDNVRPIVGYSSANLVRCGKNLFDVDVIESYTSTVDSYLTNNGDGSITVTSVETNSAVGLRKSLNQLCHMIKPNIYILTANSTGTEKQFYSATWDENTDENTDESAKWTFGSQKTLLSSMMDSAVWAYASGINTTATISNIQIELGTTATNYEPYRGQTYTADFGETVYGGTLDWSTGVLTVTWVKADLSQPYYYPTGGNGVRFGSALDDNYYINTTALALCSHGLIVKDFYTHGFIIGSKNNSVYAIGLLDVLGLSTIEEYKTWAESNTIELYYKTNHPYTIQLTPTQILAIAGLNTIYCDTGDITVTGYEDPRHTVAQLTSRIAALESAATGI